MFTELVIRWAVAAIERMADAGRCRGLGDDVAWLLSIPGVFARLSADALAWLVSCGFI